MTMYKSKVNIDGKMKTVAVINHENKKKTENVSTTVDQLHHIHILDRSGSMTGSIRQLIENVKATIKYIPDDDYVSIVWFSSAGQYKTLIKGAKRDESLNKLLDSIASTLGATCFSESLEEAGTIIDDLAAICPNFNVTLFTDGQPVVPWSSDEEIRRMMKAIDKWKNKVLALNTVGYGFYYNESLLKDVAAQSQFGQFIHASKINDYMDIFSHNYERISDMVTESVKIECFDSQILYIGDKTTKMTNETLELTKLGKRKNQFIIISENDNFHFKYNDDIYSTSNIKIAIQKATMDNLLYAYAYELYYKGERQAALDVLAKDIHDKCLIDQQMAAFTFDEVSEYTKFFKNAVLSKGLRYLGGQAPDNYLPADDALCVMDILKLLATGNNFYVYAEEGYNKIGLATVDNFNCFRKNKEEPITPIDDLVFNKNKINISIRSKIKGAITLNPKQAQAVNLPNEVPSYIWRNQTIVKDGNLNMDEITVLADDKTFALLCDYGSKVGGLLTSTASPVTVNDPISDTPVKRIRLTVNLKKLPIINRSYLREASTICSVFYPTLEQTKLEIQQKALNYLIKKIKEKIVVVSDQLFHYTDEQIALLKEHGIADDGSYKGVDLQVADKGEQDYYEARTIEFQIKDHATLPDTKKVIEAMKGNGKLNKPAIIMAGYLDNLMYEFDDPTLITENINVEQINNLYRELRKTKKDLMEKRTQIFSIKIAKVLTGDWFPELIPNGKGDYTYDKDGYTLVAKLGREKCYF